MFTNLPSSGLSNCHKLSEHPLVYRSWQLPANCGVTVSLSDLQTKRQLLVPFTCISKMMKWNDETDLTHETKFSQKHDVVGKIQSFPQREGAKNKWHFSFFGGKAEYESNTYSGGVAILLPNPSPPSWSQNTIRLYTTTSKEGSFKYFEHQHSINFLIQFMYLS